METRVSKSRSKRSRQISKSTSKEAPGPPRFKFRGLLVGGLLWGSVVLLLVLGGNLKPSLLAPGQRAPSTIVAAVDFECEDVAKTDLARRQRADAVLPVFSINYTVLNTTLRSLDSLLEEVVDHRNATEGNEPAIDPDSLNLSLTPSQAEMLFPSGAEDKAHAAIRQALETAWSKGITSQDDRLSAFGDAARSGYIRIQDPNTEGLVPVAVQDLLLPDDALEKTVNLVREQPAAAGVPRATLLALLRPLIQPNLIYESAITEYNRTEAAKEVEPVIIKVLAGSTMVEAGERITPDILEKLREHERKLSQNISPHDRTVRLIGNAGVLFVMTIVCGALIQILAPFLTRRSSAVLLMAVLSLMVLIPSKGLLVLSASSRLIEPTQVDFMLPLGLAPMLSAILLGPAAGVILGIWTSFAASVLFGNSFTILSLGLVVTVIAVYSMRDVGKRSKIFQAGLWVGVTQMLFALCLALWAQHAPAVGTSMAFTGLASGIVCALLALLLLPGFEVLFGITTDIKLLELSDMRHPLLQRLAMEAPGTYHHSLMVANLAQAAADRIGANALLARVCAYFHDIGKLTKPELFGENTQFQDNPHDDLSPTMSTLLIVAHVKEGVSLALQHKLPRPILQAIQQHHGTSMVTYFYHRARKKLESEQKEQGAKANGNKVSEEDFRYPGPKPASPEMGILLLADGIEAASRAMDKPTAIRIRNLVDEIVNDRLQDGQLDDCALTFAQLTQIRQSIIFTLTNMLHARIAYPEDESRSDQPADTDPGTPAADTKADAVAHAAGSTAG